MRRVFKDDMHERLFQQRGFVVADLLEESAVGDLWAFFADAFSEKRPVVPHARNLPYYITVFDEDHAHKHRVDELISRHVAPRLPALMIDYEVFYSNFMIKFPGDGQIEAHQDFNFVDESRFAAFNLWCPLVDTDTSNGGLFVIAGSHNVFRTQRGPNLPQALTEYNDTLKKFASWVPLRRGQAIIFDHRLIHCSPPNRTQLPRVAVQSVLTPREAPTIHYVFDAPTRRVRAYEVDRQFILDNNLWEADLSSRALNHEQDLIPLPTPREVTRNLVDLALGDAAAQDGGAVRRVFQNDATQRIFDRDGFVQLSVLTADEVRQLTRLFVDSTGGTVANSEYGMYIGLEEEDLERKRAVIRGVSSVLLPNLRRHFSDCKPHLGSFLVKAPGEDSYTCPHQDWTFVDEPRYRSITIWVALVDVDESNGALGFVTGSQRFFRRAIGSPSPEFQTCTQGHEALLYEYLKFVPLKAGEAVAFDNRIIHGATPNRTLVPRVAVAIGMTPREAQLYHYFLVPQSARDGRRKIAKLRVNEEFFERHSVAALKAAFAAGRLPDGCELEAVLEEDCSAFSSQEIQLLCEQSGLYKNGRHLVRRPMARQRDVIGGYVAGRLKSAVSRLGKVMFGN
jgi:ectoine hydroxylase-related dioxygenase (phytanoyl-CoA dioxygenase family)